MYLLKRLIYCLQRGEYALIFEKSLKIILIFLFHKFFYNCWFRFKFANERNNSNKEIKNNHYLPKFSIILPVYKIKTGYLKKAIESVINQVYEKWELCIVDDFSGDLKIKKILEGYESSDSRIKVKFLNKNLGISAASNKALEMCNGEYVVFLDHDDMLDKYALYEVVRTLQKQKYDLIYSDEAIVDKRGNIKAFHFKSDWNLNLFLSHNYITHLVVIKRNIIKKIGGFRKGFDGAQDYDLLLRVISATNRIYHIPKILYFWRSIATSTSKNPYAKKGTLIAGKKALESYLKNKKVKAKVIPNIYPPHTFRIKYVITKKELVSIIIPFRDNITLLKDLINSIIANTSYRNYELILISNNSCKEETFDYLATLKKNRNIKYFEYNIPFNFSQINNYAVRKFASGNYILFMNNDMKVINNDWLESMVEHIQRREVGAVGAKLYYGDDTIQHAGIILGIGGYAGHSHKGSRKCSSGYWGRLKLVQNVSAVTGACLLTKRNVFNNVNGFDEINLKIAGNDVDYCLKVREKGYDIIWTPYAELYHYESKSRGYEDTPEKLERFNKEVGFLRKKWGEKLLKDPYYNPNLTLNKENFSIDIKLELNDLLRCFFH